MKLNLAVALGFLLLPAGARSESHQPIYVLAIGNNMPPMSKAGEGLVQLRYADDDAAAFCDLASHFTDKIMLLSVPDDDTQRRFPQWTQLARPPTVAELRISVGGLAWQIQKDRNEGTEPTVIIFYSGHGFLSNESGPALALLDGSLTRTMLYNDILGRLPARYLHLFVDACHAEAVVRPRGFDKNLKASQIVALADEDKRTWILSRTLDRFPHVGVVMATATDQEAHEWDAYQHGVFSHEVLSGLRGAADVNLDKRIEYSELHAFLAAANRDVKDPRARLKVLVRAPTVNRRVALLDWDKPLRTGWLEGLMSQWGHFYVEDEQGSRLLDMRSEGGFNASLALPVSKTIFIRSQQGEVKFQLKPGQVKKASELVLEKPVVATRGAVESALWSGLFNTPFGPAYYNGFADRTDAISVPHPQPEIIIQTTSPRKDSKLASTLVWVGAGALLATSAVAGGLALDARNRWKATDIQRDSLEAQERYDQWRTVFFITAGGAAVATIVGALLYPSGHGEIDSQMQAVVAGNPNFSFSTSGISMAFAW